MKNTSRLNPIAEWEMLFAQIVLSMYIRFARTFLVNAALGTRERMAFLSWRRIFSFLGGAGWSISSCDAGVQFGFEIVGES